MEYEKLQGFGEQGGSPKEAPQAPQKNPSLGKGGAGGSMPFILFLLL